HGARPGAAAPGAVQPPAERHVLVLVADAWQPVRGRSLARLANRDLAPGGDVQVPVAVGRTGERRRRLLAGRQNLDRHDFQDVRCWIPVGLTGSASLAAPGWCAG